MATEKLKKNLPRYFCDSCDFKCYMKCDWNRHILRAKHLANIGSATSATEKLKKNLKKNLLNAFICDFCNKEYKNRTGLWRHKKKCECQVDIHNNIDDSVKDFEIDDSKYLSSLVLEVIKQNKELITKNNEAQKQNLQLTNRLFEMCQNSVANTSISNNVINSHNKTFNLNMFLNETCKDAMNIMEFVDSVKIQLSDLENVGKLGFVEGISNIIIKNLKALDVHKRPVHCSDSKREVMYIKDEDKWEKENNEKRKLRKAIKHIANKNSKMLPEFKAKYPDCGKSESKYVDQYNKLVIEAMGGKGDNDIEKEDKIIKNIAKEVIIDKMNE